MSYLLLKEIKSVLEAGFSQTVFRQAPENPESYGSPSVHLGDRPAKRKTTEQKQDFPFIVIRQISVTDDGNGSTAKVYLICGIHTAEDDPAAGLHDTWNMIDRIRRILQEKKILDERYELQFPMESGVSDQDEKLHPRIYYLGWVETNWSIPQIQQVQNINREGASYGEG